MSNINVDVKLVDKDIETEATMSSGINANAQVANVVERLIDREMYAGPYDITLTQEGAHIFTIKDKVGTDNLRVVQPYGKYAGPFEYSVNDEDLVLTDFIGQVVNRPIFVHQGYHDYTGDTDVTVSDDMTLQTKDKILKSNITLHPFNLPIKLELIGTWTGTLAERTSTSAQNTSTGINISNTEYLFFMATIECDGELDTSSANNWGGLTVCLGSRYTATNTGKYYSAGNIQYRGNARPKSYADVDSSNVNPITTTSYGVYGTNAQNVFTFSRRANATNCPKVMGGNYTVHVYGIKFME